jgi:hypothetical protein
MRGKPLGRYTEVNQERRRSRRCSTLETRRGARSRLLTSRSRGTPIVPVFCQYCVPIPHIGFKPPVMVLYLEGASYDHRAVRPYASGVGTSSICLPRLHCLRTLLAVVESLSEKWLLPRTLFDRGGMSSFLTLAAWMCRCRLAGDDE